MTSCGGQREGAKRLDPQIPLQISDLPVPFPDQVLCDHPREREIIYAARHLSILNMANIMLIKYF